MTGPSTCVGALVVNSGDICGHSADLVTGPSTCVGSLVVNSGDIRGE